MTEHARAGPERRSLPLQSENAWRDHTLVPYARLQGWRVYFTHYSRHSPAGFPDLTLVRRGVLLIRELKTDRGRLTSSQRDWLEALQGCGVDAGVWRPSDWLRIQEELE